MNGRILIVDDEPSIRLGVRACLEAEGYEVEEARDGAEAIRVILDTRPDVMLLDLAMPHFDGLETLHELRGRYREVMPRIIVLTAWNSLAAEEEAFLHGIGEFLAKPIAQEQLLHVIERVMHEPCADAPHDSLVDACGGENYLG